MQSRDRGSVTLPQFKRFLDVVPKTKTGFDRFIEVFKDWGHTAGWLDTNVISFEIRNKWRLDVMGLKPLPCSHCFEKDS